jgi:hypothetical protein
VATGADDPSLRRPWVVERLRPVEVQRPLQERAGGPQVAFEHALLRQSRTEGVRWSDEEALGDTAQVPRPETETGDPPPLLGRQFGQRPGSRQKSRSTILTVRRTLIR